MTLLEIVQIYGGGQGSGCNPAAGKCGRPATSQKPLSEKARLARESYVPITTAKRQLATRNEKLVANILDGMHTADNAPFDVIVKGRIGVEVKTVVKAKNDKITMHPTSLQRKVDAVKKLKLKSSYTVVIDARQDEPKWYVKEGLGSFRFGNLKDVGKVQNLRRMVR